MLLPLLALSFAQIPNGAYGMPELCAKLKEATGVGYSVDADLRDYPIFVATKSGDPERVKLLVAHALRANWVKSGDTWRLARVKGEAFADLPEFERQYKVACTGKPALLALPAKDLYQLPPGQILRYGNPSGPLHRKFPTVLQKDVQGDQGIGASILVHRMAEGIFECKIDLPGEKAAAFDSGGDIEFNSLPLAVESALKDDIDKQALTPDEQRAIQQMAASPANLKIDWSDLSKHDPVATVAQQILPTAAKAIQIDMALALPDLSLFELEMGGSVGSTVRSLLTPFGKVDDLAIVDGALIGKVPSCDRLESSQARRDVLEKFVTMTASKGVVSLDALSDYVRNQRPGASNSWADVMLLVMSGIVVDQSYLGDYPFNMRLYTELDKSDWSLVRSGQSFLASQLSMKARKELGDILLQARSRLQRDSSDPSWWTSLDPENISVRAKLADEKVLIGWTGFAAEVESVGQSADNHDLKMQSLGHEPLYQVASRQKLVLTVSSIADNQSIETGFAVVIPDEKSKPATWDKLPAEYLKEFKKRMEQTRTRPADGVPPPDQRMN